MNIRHLENTYLHRHLTTTTSKNLYLSFVLGQSRKYLGIGSLFEIFKTLFLLVLLWPVKYWTILRGIPMKQISFVWYSTVIRRLLIGFHKIALGFHWFFARIYVISWKNPAKKKFRVFSFPYTMIFHSEYCVYLLESSLARSTGAAPEKMLFPGKFSQIRWPESSTWVTCTVWFYIVTLHHIVG